MDTEEREKGDDDVMVKTTTTTSHVGIFFSKTRVLPRLLLIYYI